MIRKSVFLLTLFLAQAAIAGPPSEPFCFLPGKPFETRFLGDWELAQWKVRYSAFMRGQQVCLQAHDLSADEWFDIPEVQWDGKVLQAAFVLPSTKWRTESQLSLTQDNRIRDEYSYRDGRRVEYWTRYK